MKTMAIMAITVLITSALILPAINLAQAATNQDTGFQNLPKEFGQKIKLVQSSSTISNGVEPTQNYNSVA
jgi:hypothetical protein